MNRFEKFFPSKADTFHKPAISFEQARQLAPDAKWKIGIWRPRGGIGDLLMLTPTIKAIKREMPNSHITMITSGKYLDGALLEILWGNPDINDILDSDVSRTDKDFHFVIDMDCPCVAHEQPGKIPPNRIDLFANSIGLEAKDKRPFYKVKDKEKEWAKKFLKEQRAWDRDPLILYQPFSSGEKRSPRVRASKHILGAFREKWNKCGILVPTHSTDWAPDINFELMNCLQLKNYNVRLIAALCEVVDVVVAPDSSILHLAGALDTPLVGLFGPTAPESRLNYYPKSVAIHLSRDLGCKNCWYDPVCRFQFACWQKLTPDIVIQAVEQALSGKFSEVVHPQSLGQQTIGSITVEEI